ncbi:MAG: DUF3068 domain-containing protein [Gordonia sp. (in: high G+C Gram-positive bacteria)]
MRRVWPALLAFFGIACIAAAITVPLFLVPLLRVVPLDLDITSDASTVAPQGSAGERFPAVIMDRCSLKAAKARTLHAHLTQQRRSVIVDPSDSRQATVQSAQTVRIDRTRDAAGKESTPAKPTANGTLACDDGLLTASIDRVSLNRKTSVPNGTVSSLQLEAAPQGVDVKDVSVALPDRKGFQYKFGFGVKKRDYLVYDTTTRQNVPAKYTAEKTIDGVTTYEFVATVPEADLSSLPDAQGAAALGTMLTMPAKWWGITGRGVTPTDQITLHRYATAVRYMWVEPKTGTIINGREDQSVYFKSPDQSDDVPAAVRNYRITALKGTFQWSDDTISAQAARAKHYTGLLKLGNLWLPLILSIAGVLLLLIWTLTLRRSRRADRGDHDPRDSATQPESTDVDPVAASPVETAVAGTSAAGTDTAGTDTAETDAAGAHAAGTHVRANENQLWERPTQRIPRVVAPDSDSDNA